MTQTAQRERETTVVPPPARVDAGPGSPRRLAATSAILQALAGSAWFVEDEVLGLRDVIQPGDVCLDIGAEYGLYTVVLAKSVGPEGFVHAFEPQPGPFRLLTAGLSLLGTGNVTAHRHALGERQQQGWMNIPRRRGLPVHGRGFLTTDAMEPGPNATDFRSWGWLKVPVTTLDEFCARGSIDRVDFIKADVEGAELKVLRGGQRTLAIHRPVLQLEIQQPHIAKYGMHAADLVVWLGARGYTMHAWRDGGWRPVDEVSADRRNYLFTP